MLRSIGLRAKKADATQRLDAYAQFKSKLDALKTAVGDMTITSQVRTTSVSLSSEDSFTATTYEQCCRQLQYLCRPTQSGTKNYYRRIFLQQ